MVDFIKWIFHSHKWRPRALLLTSKAFLSFSSLYGMKTKKKKLIKPKILIFRNSINDFFLYFYFLEYSTQLLFCFKMYNIISSCDHTKIRFIFFFQVKLYASSKPAKEFWKSCRMFVKYFKAKRVMRTSFVY